MSKPVLAPEGPTELRLRALARLTGRVDATDARANSGAALSVLFELASSAATVGDALALLHELQVHQVEVELQDEELRGSRADLEANLARQVQLYELAPFAYFTLDTQTAICELNLAAARLLSATRETLQGRRFEHLLTRESASALRSMLAAIRAGAPAQTGTLRLAADFAADPMQARAIADVVDGRFLVALMSAPEDAD
jgi:PAS domain-containing protein